MTRKTIIFILLCCLIPWMQAAADPIVTAVGSGSTCPGDEVVIPVTVTNCNGVAAISLALNFDATKVSYQGYQNLNTTVSTMLVNASGGTVYMTWANMSAVNVSDGTLVELRFLGIMGSTSLNWNTIQCEYSNDSGVVLSSNYSNGSVNVYTVPSITSNPSNRNLVEGQNTTFEVGASGSGLSYQWQIKTVYDSDWQNLSNGGNHSNVNSWRLNVNNVTLDMDGNQYRCVVSGTCPSPETSLAATLTVEPYIPPIPNIVTSVGSVSTCPGVFSVPVTVTNCNNVGAISLTLNYNANLVTYVGYENANAQLANGTMRVNASRGSVYFTWASGNHALSIGDATLFSVVFKSVSGNSSLSWNTAQCEYATLAGNILPTSYNGGSLTIYYPPSITAQPSDKTVTEGQNTNFSINASGQGLSYQWQMSQDQGISWENLSNGGHYSNVNSRTLNVNNVEMSMEGLRYRCVVNGTCDPSVTSDYGTLHVNGFTPTIVTTVGSLNTCSQTEFGIPISVTNCNNVGAISLVLNYNPDVLTYAGYEGLNPELNGGQLQVNASNGKVFMAWASIEGANVGNGNLITIRFTALSGTSALSWNTAYCEYANTLGMVLPMSFSNGTVTVGDMSFSITSQPSNQTVTMEESTTFAVATSGPTSGYQWQVSQNGGASWSNISAGGHYANPTTTTLSVNNVDLEMNGYRYRCVISGSCGVQYTSNAILTVQLPVNYHEIALSADPTESGAVSGGGAHEEGQPCTVTATPATGYDFINWTENGAVVSTEASYTFTVTSDRNLVAHFALQELSIVATVVPEGTGTIEGVGTYLYGEHVLLTAIPAEGFVFDNWTEDGEVVSTNQSFSFTAQADRNLEANFSVLQLNITATAVPSNNGTVEGAGTYAYGTTVTLTAIAAEGFELANWTENDSVVSTEPTLTFVAQTDRNLVANFIIQMLHITAECDPEGSSTITGAGDYNYGDPVVLTATPLGQFEFYNWTENGEEVSTQPTISFNAYDHRNLVAHFVTTISIAATVQPEGSGAISGAGTYNFTDPVTLTATANTGYVFVNWMENDTVFSTEPTISFTAYVNRTFVANFDMIMHHVGVSSNLGAAGTVSGGGDYQEGTLATVLATPNTGFDFVRWTENGTSVSTNRNYTFTVWNDRDLMAEFELQPTDTAAFACEEFTWHGHTYTSNGIYYDTLTSYLGIDSIVALNLTIYPSFHYESYETECGNYFWEDSLYTESGDYHREYQSIYGCDSTYLLHLTILPIQALGNFTYMSPANNYVDRYTDMDFYWDAIPNANSYDFYFWQGEGGRPDTPTLSNTTSHSYQVGGLTHGTTYHWCVVAKNECQESESDIRTFTCQLNPAMSVVPNGWIDFGEVELGQSRSKTISVSGTALSEDISVAFLGNAWGQDAEFFEITPSNWNTLSGGLLHITFVPAPTQLLYNAAIRIASGAFVDTVYFTGAVANRYVFTTEVAGEVYSANDEILINGHVEDLLGNPVSEMGVNVYLMVMGTRITATAVSDANGNYSTTYTPRYSESGFYQVGSCAYGTYSNDVHDCFDIPGMSRVSSDFVIWTPYQNETLTGTIEIRNRSRIPINNINVSTISLPNGCSVSFTGVTDLGPLEVGQLNYTVTGTQVTENSNYDEANFVVSANNGITMNLTCYYHCRERRGALEVYPPSIATSMKRYNQKALSFQVTNNGNGETGPITISLPNVEWMSLLGSSTLESLPVGDSCAFSVLLAPDENVDLVHYNGSIAVNCANGNGISIPYSIEATSDSTGVLRVDVTDDNTYNGNGDHLAGADVYLKGYYSLEIIAQGQTNENGLFTVENVPEGYYYLTIHATQHKGYEAGVIYIEGGKTNYQDIYLQYQAISYSWVVVPTEVEDVYEFELVAEIHTNVPVPVVVIECPKKISPLSYEDTLQFNMTVTNYGLVNALDVQLTMPAEFREYDFYPLFDHIDTLHAKATVVVPCMVTRTQRNRDDNDDLCLDGSVIERHYWMCNAQREWDEHVQYISFDTVCLHPELIGWGAGGVAGVYPWGGVGTGEGLSWHDHYPHLFDENNQPIYTPIPNIIDALASTSTDDVATTSQDCTPCWTLLPSLFGHVLDLTGIPVSTLVDNLLYFRENVNFYSNFIETVSLDPLSLLNANRDQLVQLSRNLASYYLAFRSGSGLLGPLAGGLLGAWDWLDHLENCITYTNPYRDTPSLDNSIEQLRQSFNYYQSFLDETTNLFQEEEWMHETQLVDFLEHFTAMVDTVSYMFPSQATQQLIDVCELSYVNDSIVQRFVDRWNRSIQYWNNGIYTLEDLPEGFDDNFIKLDNAIIQPAYEAYEAANAYGYLAENEMLYSANSIVQDAMIEHKTDVCAKISVSFKQTMTMTREAFEGTLKIFNGHTTDPMQDINVNIVIKDEDGVDRTDLFQINVTSLSDITGVDGTGTLDAQKEGIAQFMMIPTIEAAPDTTKIYSFGGSFSFLDPFSGIEMTYDLFPVRLKVNPGPNLHVDYFISRYIISDDPLTEDTIEATEPAELAMMIRNVGAGNANKVYLESSQPQIIENQNGLLISFDMVGAAMNGVQRPLGLIDIPFGTIESHSAGIAEWYFTSTLMARVVHSTPHVIHNDSYGNPRLSLVTELNSHDLIKAITAYGSLEDGINDFFVNETPDFNHIPDMIYFSNGGTATVHKVITASTEGVLSETNDAILLHVTPIAAGWNYTCLDDPAEGLREIISCTRDDGQEIPLSNVWISHVTMLDEGAPIHENKLHIVDTVSVNQVTTYTIVYGEEAGSATTMQSMQLKQGWNWWSTYIEQSNINGLAMLENSLGHKGVTIKSQFDFVQNFYSDYGEDVWFGSLEGITNEQGYMIDVTEDCAPIMSGKRTKPTSHPITLQPNWNWIGYPVDSRQSVVSALSDFNASPEDLIKNQYEFSIYYDGFGWFPDDLVMNPGEGYLYYSNATGSQLLTYSNSSRDALPEKTDNRMWKTDVHSYADNISIMAVVSIDSVEQRDENLELGAFVDGECRGSARLKHFGPSDRYYAMLSVAGQDGDKVEFGFINKEKGQGSMVSENHITFVRNGIMGSLDTPYVVNFNTLKDEAQEGSIVLFPNPVERNKTFNLDLPKNEMMKEIVIVDMLGEEVLRKTGALKSNEITGLPVAGIYVVKAITESGNVYHGRLIVK